jgi:hypothetical protein
LKLALRLSGFARNIFEQITPAQRAGPGWANKGGLRLVSLTIHQARLTKATSILKLSHFGIKLNDKQLIIKKNSHLTKQL